MQKPRATSAGPVDTGLKAVQSLGGDKQLDTPTGPAPQRRFPLVYQIDRQADCLRFRAVTPHPGHRIPACEQQSASQQPNLHALEPVKAGDRTLILKAGEDPHSKTTTFHVLVKG
jgi:hypothetical protein